MTCPPLLEFAMQCAQAVFMHSSCMGCHACRHTIYSNQQHMQRPDVATVFRSIRLKWWLLASHIGPKGLLGRGHAFGPMLQPLQTVTHEGSWAHKCRQTSCVHSFGDWVKAL